MDLFDFASWFEWLGDSIGLRFDYMAYVLGLLVAWLVVQIWTLISYAIVFVWTAVINLVAGAIDTLLNGLGLHWFDTADILFILNFANSWIPLSEFLIGLVGYYAFNSLLFLTRAVRSIIPF
ncbi:MAG: hypothetical protein NXI22_21840 [bacterium]|nr:hypothetical protein [bacterium]